MWNLQCVHWEVPSQSDHWTSCTLSYTDWLWCRFHCWCCFHCTCRRRWASIGWSSVLWSLDRSFPLWSFCCDSPCIAGPRPGLKCSKVEVWPFYSRDGVWVVHRDIRYRSRCLLIIWWDWFWRVEGRSRILRTSCPCGLWGCSRRRFDACSQ